MAKVRWRWPETKNNDLLYRNLVRRTGVGEATYAKALSIGSASKRILSPHNANNDRRRRAGESRSRITVTRGSTGVDAFVNLEDKDGGAAAIEHYIAPLRKGVALGG